MFLTPFFIFNKVPLDNAKKDLLHHENLTLLKIKIPHGKLSFLQNAKYTSKRMIIATSAIYNDGEDKVVNLGCSDIFVNNKEIVSDEILDIVMDAFFGDFFEGF